MGERTPVWSAVLALSSAALFGASTPLAKLLLGGGLDPWLLAGVLYAGAGLGLGARLLVRSLGGGPGGEAHMGPRDLPWLGAVVLSGGVVGPALLMLGLTHTSAANGALLLNLEGVATMVIAWVVFRENVDRRLLIGAAAILAGAAVLSWSGPLSGEGLLGPLAIAGACLAWGIDNNLTRKLSFADPVQIAAIKGLAAGAINIGLAMSAGARLPGLATLGQGATIGLLGYGVSLVLYVLALRHLGAARTGAYFSTAPFLGAGLAFVLFGQQITLQFIVAGALFALGVWLHLTESHAHEHQHEAMDHAHRHVHDAHHQHEHGPEDPPGEPHTHAHHHGPMRHSHAHYPDLHHRHRHGRTPVRG